MNEPQYNPKLTGIQNFKIAFEKGKLEERKRIQKVISSIINRIMEEERSIQNGCILYEMKQLQKEIGDGVSKE